MTQIKNAFLKPAFGHLGVSGVEMERRGKQVSKSNSFQKRPIYAMTLQCDGYKMKDCLGSW